VNHQPSSAKPVPISVLVIDDDLVDRINLERMLRRAESSGWAIELETAQSKASALAAMRAKSFDCVLLDYRLPDGDALEVLTEIHATAGFCPPVIVQTTLNDRETSLKALALGAQDYLVKGQFDDSTLMRAIQYAIQRDQLVKERNRLTSELQEALAKVKTLSGLLPICCSCKKIRNDQGYWDQIETYLTKHSDASFSHSFCPECLEKYLKENGL
jgi:CheY-like chemotaxis protein